MIWNERTRQELRESLQAEVHKLDVEKERTEDIVPGGATLDMVSGVHYRASVYWNILVQIAHCTANAKIIDDKSYMVSFLILAFGSTNSFLY